MSVRCPHCQTENLDNGRFCNECGAPLQHVAVGATERLPDAPSERACAACGTVNPEQAVFCVNCGRSLEAPVAVSRPVATAPQRAPTLPAAPLPLMPTARASIGLSRRSRPNAAVWGGVSGGVFLIGLAVLFMTSWFWPGILVLLGIMALFGTLFGGEPRSSLTGAFWLIGLAVVAQLGAWWPGMLVLVGLTAILGALLQASRGQRRTPDQQHRA